MCKHEDLEFEGTATIWAEANYDGKRIHSLLNVEAIPISGTYKCASCGLVIEKVYFRNFL